MNYIKIIDFATSAEMLRRQIGECYRIIGAGRGMSEETIEELRKTANALQKDLDFVDKKILKLTSKPLD